MLVEEIVEESQDLRVGISISVVLKLEFRSLKEP